MAAQNTVEERRPAPQQQPVHRQGQPQKGGPRHEVHPVQQVLELDHLSQDRDCRVAFEVRLRRRTPGQVLGAHPQIGPISAADVRVVDAVVADAGLRPSVLQPDATVRQQPEGRLRRVVVQVAEVVATGDALDDGERSA